MVSPRDRINNQDNLCVISDQIHPTFAEMFTEGKAIFQDVHAPIHTVVTACHEENSSEVEHFILQP